MRITCPNCGAAYEVAVGMIPEEGRDVQCSACGHVWFERGEEEEAAVAPPPQRRRPAEPPEPEPMPEMAEEPEVAAELDEEPEPEPEPEPALRPAFAPEAEPEPEPEAIPAAVAPPRPALSPEVAAILREEAEREKAARAAARAPVIETQGELGLDLADEARPGVDIEAQRAEEARRRMARLRGQAAPPTTAPVSSEGGPPPARERLPDIEEINSTLRAASDRAPSTAFAAAEEAEALGARSRGFRRGFSFMLIAAALAAGVYAGGDRIAQAAPGLAGPVAAYVAAVDEGRLWLDLKVQELVGGASAAETVATDG